MNPSDGAGYNLKKRILVVEDHPDLLEIFQVGLVSLGCNVKVAKSGVEAIEASLELPDLIIIDIALPKMNGLEAASRIRQNSKTTDIPILAATAWVMPENRGQCLASGCDDYIAKPFTVRELETAVKRLLKE